MPVIIDHDSEVIETLTSLLPTGSHGVTGGDKLDSWLAHRSSAGSTEAVERGHEPGGPDGRRVPAGGRQQG